MSMFYTDYNAFTVCVTGDDFCRDQASREQTAPSRAAALAIRTQERGTTPLCLLQVT